MNCWRAARFRDELSVTANKIGGESRNEPKEVDHV